MAEAERAEAALREVVDWIADLRELIAQHLAFTGERRVDLIDETGLHHPLADELDTLEAVVRAESITCPVCGRTSHHPEDVRQGYCGYCSDWTSQAASERSTR